MIRVSIKVPRKTASDVDIPYGYIYMVTNQRNGKIYVGKHAKITFDKNYFGSGLLLKKALRKYGKSNFLVEVLAWASSPDELDKLEIYWINTLDSRNSTIGYNISIGGQGCGSGENSPRFGKPGTRLGAMLTEDTKAKIGASNRGKKRTPEQNEKLSERMRGVKPSEESNQKRSKTLKANKEWCKNHIIQLAELNERNQSTGQIKEMHRNNLKPIYQYTHYGEFLQKFGSKQEVKFYGFSSYCHNCASGKQPFSNGYIWSFLPPDEFTMELYFLNLSESARTMYDCYISKENADYFQKYQKEVCSKFSNC